MHIENEAMLKGYKFAIEDADNKEFILEDLLGFREDGSTLDKIQYEIGESVINEVLCYLESTYEEMKDAFESEEFIEQEEAKEKLDK